MSQKKIKNFDTNYIKRVLKNKNLSLREKQEKIEKFQYNIIKEIPKPLIDLIKYFKNKIEPAINQSFKRTSEQVSSPKNDDNENKKKKKKVLIQLIIAI